MNASFETVRATRSEDQRTAAGNVAVTHGSSGGHFEVAWEIVEDAMSQEAMEDIENAGVPFCATCQGRRDAMR